MYEKKGNRVSLLPISQFCGLSAKLGEQHGAGRAAACSTAFHAKAAGSPDAAEKLARLTPKEQATISTWTTPPDVEVNGHTLRYSEADKEQPVGLTAAGEWADSGEVITCGTLDFAWVRDGVALVGDIKKTAWTTSGPDSLQLLAYGYAWAKKHDCHSFCVGLWLVEEKEWRWSSTVYRMDDFDSLELWGRIAHAALNTSNEAAFGEHCGSCYSRLHCPEYTAPAALAETVLGPACEGGDLDDPAKLSELYAFCERVEGMIDKVKEHAKEAARRGVTITHPVSGKILSFTMVKGRESLNTARLYEALPQAKGFIERGLPYSRAAWAKPKVGK